MVVFNMFDNAIFGDETQFDIKSALNRGLSETVVITDDVGRVKGFVRALSESETIGDVVARVKGFVRALSESESIMDSVARVLGFHRFITDSTGQINSIFGNDDDQSIETFATYPDQTTADANWIPIDTNCRVNVTSNELEIIAQRDGSNDNAYFDLGSPISDTVWELRCKLNASIFTGGGSIINEIFFGISDSATANFALGLHNHISFRVRRSTSDFFHITYKENPNSLQAPTLFTWFPVEGVDYWIKISRIDATNVRVGVYSDVNFNTLIEAGEATIPAGITGLRYIRLNNRNDSTGSLADITLGIDDIQLFHPFINILISDTVSKSQVLGRALSETIIVGADVVARVVAQLRAISDPAITIMDSVSISQALNRALNELIPVSDIVVRAGSTYNRFITETIVISDVVSAPLAVIRALSETETISDMVSRVKDLPRSISEPTVTVGADIVSAVKAWGRAVSETVNITDIVSRITSVSRILSEPSVTVMDSVSIMTGFLRTIAEPAVTISDLISRAGSTYNRAISEIAVIIDDSVSTRSDLIRVISEPAVIIDDAVARLSVLFRSITDPSVLITDSVVFNAFLTLVLRFPTRIKDILSFGTRIKQDLNSTSRISDIGDNTI